MRQTLTHSHDPHVVAEKPGAHTLIRDLSQNPVVSKGEFVVEAGTGRVRRARMVTVIGAMTAELTTTYAPEARLGMWVPVSFAERYQSGAKIAIAPDPRINLPTWFEEIRCLATYANYRRFEVKVDYQIERWIYNLLLVICY